ncbi:MAG: hypothetical protein ACUVX9_01370 [Anaerolineae bacterium]
MRMQTVTHRPGAAQTWLRHPESALLILVLLATVAVVLLSERGNSWLSARLAVSPAQPSAARPAEMIGPAVNWQSVGSLGRDYLQAYLALDTSRVEGRREAAQWLYGILRGAGIESHMVGSGSGSPAVMARVRGSGAARPIVLYTAIGTPDADMSRWTKPPYGGEEEGGYLYGAGAATSKGTGVVHVLTMLVLQRLGLPLERDVVLLAAADDSALTDPESDVALALGRLRPEFLLSFGGGGLQELQPGEMAWMVGAFSQGKMVVRLGPERSAELGALPAEAGERLLQGIMRLQAWRPAITFSATTREYFGRLAARYPFGIRQLLSLPWAWTRLIAPQLEQRGGQLRDSASLLRMEPWPDDPLCPSALLQVRTMPSRSREQVLSDMGQQVRGLGLRLQLVSVEAGREAAWCTAAFEAVERALVLEDPSAVVLPTGGAPDLSRRLAVPGVACYGLTPFEMDAAELERVSGGDERLAVGQIAPATLRMVRIVVALAGQEWLGGR